MSKAYRLHGETWSYRISFAVVAVCVVALLAIGGLILGSVLTAREPGIPSRITLVLFLVSQMAGVAAYGWAFWQGRFVNSSKYLVDLRGGPVPFDAYEARVQLGLRLFTRLWLVSAALLAATAALWSLE